MIRIKVLNKLTNELEKKADTLGLQKEKLENGSLKIHLNDQLDLVVRDRAGLQGIDGITAVKSKIGDGTFSHGNTLDTVSFDVTVASDTNVWTLEGEAEPTYTDDSLANYILTVFVDISDLNEISFI